MLEVFMLIDYHQFAPRKHLLDLCPQDPTIWLLERKKLTLAGVASLSILSPSNMNLKALAGTFLRLEQASKILPMDVFFFTLKQVSSPLQQKLTRLECGSYLIFDANCNDFALCCFLLLWLLSKCIVFFSHIFLSVNCSIQSKTSTSIYPLNYLNPTESDIQNQRYQVKIDKLTIRSRYYTQRSHFI